MDEIDSSKRHVIEIPLDERRDRCQDMEYKMDSPPDVKPDIFQNGVFKRKSPPAER